jgi:outer membrane lipoprotein LolB
MSRIRTLLALVALILTLAGCVSQAPRPPAVPVDRAQAEAADRERALIQEWSLSGRIAVSNGNQGGSGRIDWRQAGERYTVSLSAPITRQSWRLSGDPGGARLEGVEGGPRESPDVEAMLYETTGWDIPVRALADWVRGVGAAPAEFGEARVVYGAGGRPARLEQSGWVIDYTQWQDAGQPVLPTRLVATRGQAKVRLVVDQWSLAATP